jgi:glycosyltransferase involved in cell wall biosynthesis
MTTARAPHRVLVVTATFPPDGGVGSLRTLRLLKHLAETGTEQEVLTVAPSTYRPGTVLDVERLALIPPGVVVTEAPALRPIARLVAALRRRTSPAGGTGPRPASAAREAVAGREGGLRRVGRAARALVTLPDAEASWILPAVRRGLRRTHAARPDVIYSSGPPYSAHVVAGTIARLRGIPWIADFRDPWARAPWRDDRFGFEKRAWAIFEREIVVRADAAIFVTQANPDDFAAQYGVSVARKFYVIPNGCDLGDFEGLKGHPAAGRFVLLHAGSLYGARDPSPLFRAVATGVADGRIDPSRFRIRLIGRIGIPGVNLESTLRALGIAHLVEFVPHVPRLQALQEMVDASALLVIQPVTRLSVPGKLYEYLAARRPILGLAEPSGDTAALLRRTPAGTVVSPDDHDGILRALTGLMAGGTRTVETERALYDGATRARELATVLRSVTRPGAIGGMQDVLPAPSKRS